jgi:hypothetical protein
VNWYRVDYFDGSTWKLACELAAANEYEALRWTQQSVRAAAGRRLRATLLRRLR